MAVTRIAMPFIVVISKSKVPERRVMGFALVVFLLVVHVLVVRILIVVTISYK
jgi:hypothetical protein